MGAELDCEKPAWREGKREHWEKSQEALGSDPSRRDPKCARKCMGIELNCEKPASREGKCERCEKSQETLTSAPSRRSIPRITIGRSNLREE